MMSTMGWARKAGVAVSMATVVACTPRAPAAATPAPEMRIQASLGRTWDAAIDHFATATIPIRTLERASGIIVSDPLGIPLSTQKEILASQTLADCGADMLGTEGYPGFVSYNVRVLGDSSAATLRVTAFFYKAGSGSGQGELSRRPEDVCSTKGVLERQVQDSIRARAEKR